MFDIGFSELLLIAVVALVVLGPERLPKAARLAGMWARKARAQWNAVKAELENELADEELRRNIRETSDAMREGMQQVHALPETLRNNPVVTGSATQMTSLDASQRATAQADAPALTVPPQPVHERWEYAGYAVADDAPAQPDHDPAQMSLLDPDPQMSLLPPTTQPRSDGQA
jgi:sec-independent protein translocase protein TatB